MSYSPIAFIAPNYRDYPNYWLKTYEPATTTTKPIALDSNGDVQVAKLQLNADGFFVSAGQTISMPYVDGRYDAYLFPTEAEADSNDTSNAIRVADGILGVNGETSAADIVSLQDITGDSSLSVGDYVHISDRGMGLFKMESGVTPDEKRVVTTGTDGIFAVLQIIANQTNISHWGGITLEGENASTSGAVPAEFRSTEYVQAILDWMPTSTNIQINVDGYYAIEELSWQNKNPSFSGTGLDRFGTGFKWALGRHEDNHLKSMFTGRGWRFAPFENMRICGPAAYDFDDPLYNPNHTLKAVWNVLWRQEEGDRINTTLKFRDVYIGWYDSDGWDLTFASRHARQFNYGIITENEIGFNNNGNSDFHQFDNITMYQVNCGFSCQNAQNLGWVADGLQFFWGGKVAEMPDGGLMYFFNPFISGTNTEPAVFDCGATSTSVITEYYIENLTTERILNDIFIRGNSGRVKFNVSGGGRCGFRTEEETTGGYHRLVDINQLCIASDVKFQGSELIEDSGSSGTANFRYRYNTNSRGHRLHFENCRGAAVENDSMFETGGNQNWIVDFIVNEYSTASNFNGSNSQYKNYRTKVNYLHGNLLKDAFGRIPLSSIYNLPYYQQENGLAIGVGGVDAVTTLESVTYRVKPLAANDFDLANVITPDMNIVNISVNFVYNSTPASFFKVLSGDSLFTFGQGICNGSSAQRNANLTNQGQGMYQSDSVTNIRFEGYSDAALTMPASFSSTSDSQTCAVTIHFIRNNREYLDPDEYLMLDLTNGV